MPNQTHTLEIDRGDFNDEISLGDLKAFLSNLSDTTTVRIQIGAERREVAMVEFDSATNEVVLS